MRVIVLVLMILSFAAVPLCQADEDVLKKAKSLYYKGQQEHAIRWWKIMFRKILIPVHIIFWGMPIMKCSRWIRPMNTFPKHSV